MKCKDIAKELGTTAQHIGRVKAEIAPDCGLDIPPDVAKQIFEYVNSVAEEAKKELQEVLSHPTIVVGKVIGPGRNRHVLIAIKGKGRFPALMPTSNNAGLVGRRLEFEEVEYEGNSYYRHKSLSNMTFHARHTKI